MDLKLALGKRRMGKKTHKSCFSAGGIGNITYGSRHLRLGLEKDEQGRVSAPAEQRRVSGSILFERWVGAGGEFITFVQFCSGCDIVT